MFAKSNEVERLLDLQSKAVTDVFDYYNNAIVVIIRGCTKEQTKLFMTEIDEYENKADLIRHQIIKELLDGGLLLDSRKAFARVIEFVDKIANLCEDIIEEIYLQNLCLDISLLEPIEKMNEVTQKQLVLLSKAIKAIVTNYKLKDMIIQIREIEVLESEVDKIEHAAIKSIFDSDMDLSEKLQLKNIIRMVGHIADIVEDVSDELEIIMMTRRV